MTSDDKSRPATKTTSDTDRESRLEADDPCRGCLAGTCVTCPHWIAKVNSEAAHHLVERLRGRAK